MKYEELKVQLADVDILRTIKILQSQKRDVDIDLLKKQWSVGKHGVLDPTKRKDREISYEEDASTPDEPNKVNVKKRPEPVNRIPVPMQKNIVGKAVSFLFGNPVVITSDARTESELAIVDSISKILDDNKTDSQNRVVAKNLFRSTQVAEIWYPVKGESHEEYGFVTEFKLRMGIFTPWTGSELFPYFDDHNDMIAFSRQYTVKDDEDKEIVYFETYTAEQYFKWQQSGSEWIQVEKVDNPLKRIPVVYAEQEEAEWADVQYAIERLEVLLSNHADTNDYNGSPTIVTKGEILSLGKKGEQGKVLEVEKGGDVSYMSWDHAPESIKMEIENLFKIIHTYTQTPDISFEAVKGIGAISGIALKLLFMDAHLKVMDKRETFDPYLKRRLNIIKSFVGEMNKSSAATAKKLKINAEITPYIIADDLERIKVLTEANGGKAVICQRTSVLLADMAEDGEEEFKQIQKEFKETSIIDISEPVE